MKFTLIPSSFAGTNPGHYQFLSSSLINDTIALDAGCVGFFRSPQEQARIRNVVLSHTHMDHLASLPIFVENAYEGRGEGVTIHGSAAVLEACQQDLFNDRIWPDFVALSQGEKPFLKLSLFEPGQTIELDGVRITSVPLNHVVPTVGYVISDGRSSIGFISDTGPTEEIWQRLNAQPDLKAVFLEATFPNSMAWLAEVSKHLTPATFAQEVRKLKRPAKFIVMHIKARFQAEVIAELQALNLPGLEIGRFGQAYEF